MPPKVRTLKLNGPRRRESERMKTRRSASTASTPTTPVSATSASSAGDTIEVAQKSSDGHVEGMLDAPTENLNDAVAGATEELPAKAAETPVVEVAMPKQPAQEKGKGKEGVEMEDMDDTVTEYDFTNETESAFDDDENEDHGIFKDDNAVHEIIEISSDDGAPVENFELSKRPWLEMRPEERAKREVMFCRYPEEHPDIAKHGWQHAEDFMEYLDTEMEEYIKDFPPPSWVIDPGVAHPGMDRMVYRKNLRLANVQIFTQQILAERGLPFPFDPRMSMPMDHRSQGHGHHQMPLNQHQMSQQIPSHMMHHGGAPYGMAAGPVQAPFVLPSQSQMMPGNVDRNGRPLQQLQHHQSMQPPMAQPRRAQSHPQKAVKRPSANGSEPNMQPYLPESGRRKRQKRETQTTAAAPVAPTDPAIVPPYEPRVKPKTEPNATTKSGKSSRSRVAMPSEFPWNRQLNFEGAKVNARWDLSMYTTATLVEMERVRDANAPYVDRVDQEETEKQRHTRSARNLGIPDRADELLDTAKPKRQKKEPKNVDSGEGSSALTTDHHSFGNFCYATETDSHKAMGLSKMPELAKLGLSDKPSVEELMEASDMGQLDLNKYLKGINICWNPVKKGLTQDLQQVSFSISDSLLTREQLSRTPVLTEEAADSIIDFCPDLLWRDLLLRITSESPLRNKEVRERMCKNGVWMDKATITKRIGSALGQKQSKNRGEEEEAADDAYYAANTEDYHNYQKFFGKGQLTRKSWIGQSLKRKHDGTEDVDSDPTGSRPVSSGSDGSVMVVTRALSSNKGKRKVPVIPQLDGAADEEVVVEEDESDEMEVVVGGKAVDEVSVQSDGELDRLLGDDSD